MAAVRAVAWDDLKTMADEFFEWSKIEAQKKEFRQAKEYLCKNLLDKLADAFGSVSAVTFITAGNVLQSTGKANAYLNR